MEGVFSKSDFGAGRAAAKRCKACDGCWASSSAGLMGKTTPALSTGSTADTTSAKPLPLCLLVLV